MQSKYLFAQSNTFRASLAVTLFLVASVSGCTKPRQTTAIGSGVGGAIGAGLGAIVGNQTGNAGSGLAIGAGAGAAVGALVGNALQAQEERNSSQDEAIKRQERVIQAQRNEINELRSIRGDDSYSYNASSATSPRYRYRGTTTDPESPEVARQRAKLQQRGPSPRKSNGGINSTSYYSYNSSRASTTARQTTPPQQPAPARRVYTEPERPTAERAASERLPTAVLPAASVSSMQQTNKPLARYDVRSELSDRKTTPPAAVVPVIRSEPSKIEPKKMEETRDNTADGGISESDIQAPSVKSETTARATAPVPASPAQSKECKEALAERDLAAEATDNSDKLFHLRRALRLCPQSAPLHHELGRVYASMQRSKDAEEEFKQALSIDPSFSAAKRELGSLLKEEIQF
jgi:hypothetical protein